MATYGPYSLEAVVIRHDMGVVPLTHIGNHRQPEKELMLNLPIPKIPLSQPPHMKGNLGSQGRERKNPMPVMGDRDRRKQTGGHQHKRQDKEHVRDKANEPGG